MSFLGQLFGTDSAANKVRDAQKKNIAQAEQTRQQNNDLLAPYVNQGTQATNTIGSLLGFNGADAQTAAYNGYQMSPDYQVRYKTGLDALQRSALGKYGTLANGNILKSITQYGQDQGQLGYNDYYNKLTGQQGIGFQGTTANVNSNMGASSAIQNANTQIGQAGANADLAAGGMLMSGLGTLAGLAGYGLGPGFLRPTATTGRTQTPLLMNNGGSSYFW